MFNLYKVLRRKKLIIVSDRPIETNGYGRFSTVLRHSVFIFSHSLPLLIRASILRECVCGVCVFAFTISSSNVANIIIRRRLMTVVYIASRITVHHSSVWCVDLVIEISTLQAGLTMAHKSFHSTMADFGRYLK